MFPGPGPRESNVWPTPYRFADAGNTGIDLTPTISWSSAPAQSSYTVAADVDSLKK
jgi:hypothetical protein